MEPTALRCARDRILTRGANAAAGALTPLETGIAADVNLINAHTDPAVRALKLSSTRGGTTAGARWRKRKAMPGWRLLGLTERGTSAP